MADWLRVVRHPVDPVTRQAVEDALYERARLGGQITRNFVVLSLLSSSIAGMGLLLDSAPAVIGAMLLGPFISPLVAMAGSLVQGWGKRLARATLMVAFGVGLSITAAYAVGRLFAPQLELEVFPPLLLSLTRPGLLDLGIALAAGIAAGYATMRTDAAGALSGVAVSVTLEPPLAAMGLYLAAGDDEALRRSGLTFLTNFGALVLGATFALAWWGFGDRARRGAHARAGVGLAAWLALMAAITVPLALYSGQVLRDTEFERDVGRVVADWDPTVRVVSIDAEIRGDRAEVRLDITGPRSPEPAWRLAEELSERHGARVSVTVTFTLAQEDRAISTD